MNMFLFLLLFCLVFPFTLPFGPSTADLVAYTVGFYSIFQFTKSSLLLSWLKNSGLLSLMTAFVLLVFFIGNISYLDSYSYINFLLFVRRCLPVFSILASIFLVLRFKFSQSYVYITFFALSLAPVFVILVSFLTSCFSSYTPVCYFGNTAYSASYLLLGNMVMLVSLFNSPCFLALRRNIWYEALYSVSVFFLYPIVIFAFGSRGALVALFLIILLSALPSFTAFIRRFRVSRMFFALLVLVSLSLSLLVFTFQSFVSLDEYRAINRIASYFFSGDLVQTTLNTGRFRENRLIEESLLYSRDWITFMFGNGNGYFYLLRGNWLAPSAYDSLWRLLFIDYGLLGLIFLFLVTAKILFAQISRLFLLPLFLRVPISYVIAILLLTSFTNELFFMDAMAPQFSFLMVYSFVFSFLYLSRASSFFSTSSLN